VVVWSGYGRIAMTYYVIYVGSRGSLIVDAFTKEENAIEHAKAKKGILTLALWCTSRHTEDK
jgi:hypothetical protein